MSAGTRQGEKVAEQRRPSIGLDGDRMGPGGLERIPASASASASASTWLWLLASIGDGGDEPKPGDDDDDDDDDCTRHMAHSAPELRPLRTPAALIPLITALFRLVQLTATPIHAALWSRPAALTRDKRRGPCHLRPYGLRQGRRSPQLRVRPAAARSATKPRSETSTDTDTTRPTPARPSTRRKGQW